MSDPTEDLPPAEELVHHRVTPVVKGLLAAVTVTVLLLALNAWDSANRADELDRKADALSESLAARAEVIDELAAGQDAMRAQLEEEGIEPAVPDPSVTIREVIRETGAQGVQGTAGRDGRDGITPACWFEHSQCRGEPGADSTVPGPAGADGQDSTVPGPPGPPGADSTVPGPQGSQGAPGPSCPPGYEQRVIDQGPNQGWIACAPTGAP